MKHFVQVALNLEHEVEGAAYLKIREKGGKLHPQLSPGVRFYRAHLMDTDREVEVLQWETNNPVDVTILVDRLFGLGIARHRIRELMRWD